jgi:hypothetical protein
VEKWWSEAIDYSMVHAHYMLDTQVYKHTDKICNTHCFSIATIVARTRLNVTLYVHCLSFKAFCNEAEGKNTRVHPFVCLPARDFVSATKVFVEFS